MTQSHNGIHTSVKNEWTTATCKMNESQKEGWAKRQVTKNKHSIAPLFKVQKQATRVQEAKTIKLEKSRQMPRTILVPHSIIPQQFMKGSQISDLN